MTKYPTIIGFISILIWSFGSLLYAFLQNIPAGEITTICLMFSFILAVIKITIQNSWHEIKQPLPVWICGFGGTAYYTASFSFASKIVPIEKVSLIAASTPIVILIMSAIFFRLKFNLRYILATIIGFMGIYILTAKGGIISFSLNEAKGYLLAFSCAIGLSLFTLGAKAYKPPLDLIGLYCGIGAILGLFYHLNYENSVMPTNPQWLYLFLLGALIN